MKIEETKFPDVKILIPNIFQDERGFFSESWNKEKLEKAELDYEFVQDNRSVSVKAGTIRGLHFQSPPHAQAKLVRCAQGSIFDVVVDFRNGSPTFGEWVGVELSAANAKQLLIPTGFLHGFVTRTANTEVIYKCTAHYQPECDGGVRFDDTDIGIDWGLDGMPCLSKKDSNAPILKYVESPFSWEEEE